MGVVSLRSCGEAPTKRPSFGELAKERQQEEDRSLDSGTQEELSAAQRPTENPESPKQTLPFPPFIRAKVLFFSQPARPRVYQTLEAKYFTPRKKKQASCPGDRVEKPVDLKKKLLGIES